MHHRCSILPVCLTQPSPLLNQQSSQTHFYPYTDWYITKYYDPSSSFLFACFSGLPLHLLQPPCNRHWRDQEHLERQTTHVSISSTDSNSFHQILEALCSSYHFLRSSSFLFKFTKISPTLVFPNPAKLRNVIMFQFRSSIHYKLNE